MLREISKEEEDKQQLYCSPCQHSMPRVSPLEITVWCSLAGIRSAPVCGHAFDWQLGPRDCVCCELPVNAAQAGGEFRIGVGEVVIQT